MIVEFALYSDTFVYLSFTEAVYILHKPFLA